MGEKFFILFISKTLGASAQIKINKKNNEIKPCLLMQIFTLPILYIQYSEDYWYFQQSCGIKFVIYLIFGRVVQLAL